MKIETAGDHWHESINFYWNMFVSLTSFGLSNPIQCILWLKEQNTPKIGWGCYLVGVQVIQDRLKHIGIGMGQEILSRIKTQR